MNTQESNEYNKLSAPQREEYDFQKRKHPNWNHDQIMAKVALAEKTDEVVEKSGGDVDVNDKNIMKSIIDGAGKWLQRYVPRIWEGVKNIFANILDGIINGVINFFEDAIASIFS